ncbi:hypothetical protein K474DRAFT_1770329 [Panus rudis PR-1116 ss-1]|nr:hypothetical protein K474DRAFT_1770329 [Panus rudis PR-1116 ss-1]
MTVITPLRPPTSQLPVLRNLKHISFEDLLNAIRYLRLLYNPEVRGTRRIEQAVVYSANASEAAAATSALRQRLRSDATKIESSSLLEHSLDAIRADEFERSYSIRWLTTLVSQAERLCAHYDEDHSPLSNEGASSDMEKLIEEAAALLAVCAGTASAGTVTRMFVFPYSSGPRVKVQITDAPLENHDYSSVGAQTWGSACLLAEMISDSPDVFGLSMARQGDGYLRILELGAGTGLVSLTVAKLLETATYSQLGSQTTVIASDFHPTVLANLRRNVRDNVSMESSCSIGVHFLDWSQFPQSTPSPPFDAAFDIIFGADIIYEAEHAEWIRNCLRLLLRKPSRHMPNPRFHLVIPLRHTHASEARAVDEIFPTGHPLSIDDLCDFPILGIVNKDIILCEVGGNVRSRSHGPDVLEYVRYTIAWIKVT